MNQMILSQKDPTTCNGIISYFTSLYETLPNDHDEIKYIEVNIDDERCCIIL